MNTLIKAYPLYKFANYCEREASHGKRVLDCGAGGNLPPLILFKELGYEVHGIELDAEQIERAERFQKDRGIELNIQKGDMERLPFLQGEMDMLYSYNTSVHIPKMKFKSILQEFRRVLKDGGLCYVNFLGYESDTAKEGEEVSPGEFLSQDEDGQVRFVHYHQEELLDILNGFKVVNKEIRDAEREVGDEVYRSVYFEFILRKRA